MEYIKWRISTASSQKWRRINFTNNARLLTVVYRNFCFSGQERFLPHINGREYPFKNVRLTYSCETPRNLHSLSHIWTDERTDNGIILKRLCYRLQYICRSSLLISIFYHILTCTRSAKVSQFVNDRERYELEVDQNNTKLPNLIVVFSTSSIDHKLLKQMVLLGEFNKIGPDKTAEELICDKIKQLTNSIAKKQLAYSAHMHQESVEEFTHADLPRWLRLAALYFAICFFSNDLKT